MLRHTKLEHHFVQYIPDQLEPGIIYISMEYATAAHGCCCGCGEQVITPFTPNDWKLTYDGETVSLWPSIGNWNFLCRSHYIVRQGMILNAGPWEDKQTGRSGWCDVRLDEKSYDGKIKSENATSVLSASEVESENLGLWGQIKKRIRKKRR